MLALLAVLVFVEPLLVVPFTADALEVGKQTLLLIGVAVLMLLWLVKSLRQRTLGVRFDRLLLLPIALTIGLFISALQSPARLLSFVGESTQEYQSVLTALGGALLVFLIVQIVRTQRARQTMIASLVGSAVLAGAFLIAQMVRGDVFNTIGSVNTAAAFLVIVAALAQAWLTLDPQARRWWSRLLVHALGFETLFVLLVLDSPTLWVLLLGASLLIMTTAARATLTAAVASIAALVFLLLPSPFTFPLPAEVVPSATASWQITKETLSDETTSVLFGTGPGTFVFDYTKERSALLNTTPFWNIRFDRGYNTFLTSLATTGLVGTALLLLLFVSIAVCALRSRSPAASILLVPWVLLFVASWLFASTMTFTILFWVLFGLLVSELASREKSYPFASRSSFGTALTLALVFVSVAVVTILFVAVERYGSELAYGKAVELDAQQADEGQIIAALDKAALLNRWSDIGYRALAEALLSQVKTALAAQEVSSEDMDRVRELIGASVAAAGRATELSPHNVANWEVRGAVYQAIAGVVEGADAFAINAYKTAHELEPASPVHLTNLGRSYSVFAKRSQTLAQSEDAAIASAAQQQTDEYLRQAESALVAAIELKSDYGPAHYELALVYEVQGRLSEAVTKMESVKRYHPLDVGVAFQLGVLYLKQGKTVEAKSELRRALELVPTFVNAHWYLAAVYEFDGQLEAASGELEQILAILPNNEAVKAKLARLREGIAATAIPEPIEE